VVFVFVFALPYTTRHRLPEINGIIVTDRSLKHIDIDGCQLCHRRLMVNDVDSEGSVIYGILLPVPTIRLAFKIMIGLIGFKIYLLQKRERDLEVV
jgi:hypothetical protein